MRAWLYLIAAGVAGAVITTPALVVLVFAGGSVDDALFAALGTLMLVAGLAVVTMRDIIRCGLAMIVCVPRPRRDLRGRRRAARGRGPGDRLHRRDQRPDPVRDHAHPVEGGPGPPRLPDPGRPGGRRRDRPRRPRSRLGVAATDWGEAGERVRLATDTLARVLFDEYVLPFEVVSVLLLAAVIGGVFIAKREREPD